MVLKGWFSNGPDFKWDLKSGSPQSFENWTNGCHFVQNHFNSGQKCLDFERSGFQMVGTIDIAKG